MNYRHFGATLLTVALLITIATYPGAASATGFAKESLFLSKTPVTEGETVLIHAVVANDTTTPFSGEVVFKDGVATIGTVRATIAAGGATAVSVSWKPSAGSHAVTAALTLSDGTVLESESSTFVINEKPKATSSATATSPTAVESSAAIQQKINDLSPAVGSVSAPIFSTLDTFRTQATGVLDQGINWAKKKSLGKTPGEVLGEATSADSGGIMGTVWLILATIVLYIFSVLRFVVGTAGIFYPVFALLFFYILWRLFRRIRRPQHA